MPELLETQTLVAAIEQRPPAHTFLRNTFFPGSVTHPTRTIKVDIYKAGRKLAPYVSPVQAGQVMNDNGYRTDTIELPYLKPKYIIDAVVALLKAVGESPFSAKTALERAREKLNKKLGEGQAAIARTIEVQASQALVTGKVTAKGTDAEGIAWTIEIDFGRSASHTVTKTAGNYWSDAIDPFSDLRAWGKTILTDSGYNPDVVVMGDSVVDAFLNNSIVQKLLDNRRMELGNIDMTPFDGQGVKHVGSTQSLDFFSYVEQYEDPATGVLTPMVPANALIMGSRKTRNTVNYGAIVDLEHNPASAIEREIFAKSWVEKDPSSQVLLLQSSPLATSHEPDSTLVAYPVA